MVSKTSKRFVMFLKELSKNEVTLAGGKGANLAEMYNLSLPVPDAFVVLADAYKFFIEKTGLKERIRNVLRGLDVNDTKQLERKTALIRKMIISTEMPKEIRKEIEHAYETLSREFNEREIYVAIRSSATAEDLPQASFAGQQLTLLNVKRAENVIEGVKRCWASLFTARATFYREEKGFSHEKVAIAVIVQKQLGAIPYEEYLKGNYKAGVGFTVHPSTGEKNKVVIEGSWGQGESIVSGSVTPDTYVLDKKTGRVIEINIAKKSRMRIADLKECGLKEVDVPPHLQEKQCLTENELRELHRLALKLERYYRFPQDFEWVSERGKIYLVQTRPITVLYGEKQKEAEAKQRAILKGLPASPGIASGRVRIVRNLSELSKVGKGDVLVTKMTNPDMVPVMRKAGAIITDEGGITCHAAIVSRELGIPCIVGTERATEVLKEGMKVTVDASRGLVYEGVITSILSSQKKITKEELKKIAKLRTRTKILMNLGVPERINEYRHLPFDGIGLMRVEFIIASQIGEHPNLLLEQHRERVYINRLANGIRKVAKAIYPRFVVVRFSDFKTNEYRELKGGERYEPHEDNPMLGWRGVSRYISKEFEQAFRLECRAIKKVRDSGCDNVWVMLPFVRTLWEVERCLEIMKEEGLKRSGTFKVWLMAEVPSVILLAERFAKLCDGFSVGSNDLTQLILGIDRDSGMLAKLGYFDERNEAVKRAIKSLIRVAHKNNVRVSICGQAPSVYEDFCEFLVRSGIDSISVNPDAVVKTRKLVWEIERKMKKK